MTMTEFEYHIYAKGEVLFHCLSEEDFQVKWQMLNSMCGPGTPLGKVANLSFERILARDNSCTEEHSY